MSPTRLLATSKVKAYVLLEVKQEVVIKKKKVKQEESWSPAVWANSWTRFNQISNKIWDCEEYVVYSL